VYFLPPVTEDAHVFFPEDSGAYWLSLLERLIKCIELTHLLT